MEEFSEKSQRCDMGRSCHQYRCLPCAIIFSVKEEYFMLVSSNPKKLVSPMDFEISQKCKMLLASDPTLKGIPNKSCKYCVYDSSRSGF